MNDTTPRVGQTLTVTPSTSSYGGWAPAPIKFTYQWYRCSTNACYLSGSATTSRSHVVAAAEKGFRLKVRVTGTKSGYTTVSKYSSLTSAVTPGILTTTTPKISDTTPYVGQAVTVTPSSTSPSGWGPTPVSFSYQWYKCSSSTSCTAVGSATTSRTHVVSAAENGYRLKVRVTAKKASYTTVSKYSALSAAVAPTALLATVQSFYPTFATTTVSGDGTDVVSLPAGAVAGLLTVTSGGSDLEITALDSTNEIVDWPVSVYGGPYSGTTAYGLWGADFGTPVKLAVDSDGPWTITIQPVSSAPLLPAGTVGGTGDHVYLYTGSAADWTLSYEGEGWFAVDQWLLWGTYAPAPNFLALETDPFSGVVPAMAGPGVLTVQSEGPWSITRP